MHNRHFNKNRAPQIGSSTFFSNKQERHEHRYKQHILEDETKYQRPNRTLRRQNKIKESKVFKYRLLIKDYDSLTKFKTFLTFLRKKLDIRSINVNNEELLNYDELDLTEGDVDSLHTMYTNYGMPVDRNSIAKRINLALHVEFSFTNKRTKVEIEKNVGIEQDGNNLTWLSSSAALHAYRDNIVDLRDDKIAMSDKLKTILTEINRNLKHPMYI